ncbi:MAG: hypothetical protein L3J16_07215 [Anaerolineales bacterium]|nr:hypothetical protein [Anaerolineales bacterium]
MIFGQNPVHVTASGVDKMDDHLLRLYNYDEFVPEKFERWLNFESSPPLGQPAPDFLLWQLDESETRLSDVWSAHALTVVEFGSFT